MKIRSKLFLWFIVIAGVSVLLATFFAIYSISQNYKSIAIDETLSTKKNVENVFYEYMGELTRKGVFLSELNEIVDNIDDADELFIALENKSFFLFNINTKIVTPDLKIVISFNNSSESIINQEKLNNLPFFQNDRDPLIRDTGLFMIDNKICMLTVSPLVDQNTFDFKGYIFFELYLNSEFADQLKEKTNGDIIVITEKEKMASSFQDLEGERFFPVIPRESESGIKKVKILGDNYFVDSFPVVDYFEKTIGEIFVAFNIKDIISARKYVIQNILIVLVIVVILVVLISLFIGRKLTKPLLVLSKGAESISKGKFDITTEPSSKDEIGSLSRVFNKMVESLKAQREEILDLKLFYEKIIDNSPSAIFICDELGKIISANPAAERIFNIKPSEIVGKEIFRVINFPPSIEADFYKVIFSGNPAYHDSYPLFLSDEEEKMFRLTLYKIILKKGISVAIQIEDITERLRMEEELTHAKKLGTMGEVLSRFTHEFNNIMTGIIGHIDLLKNETENEDGSISRVNSIENLALKAHNLGKNILSFSRKEKFERDKIEIVELIKSVLVLIEKTVLNDVEVKKDYPQGPFYIMANQERLSLALFNLLINSKDAIREAHLKKGKISIGVDWVYDKNKTERFIKLEISDNGVGIEEKNIDKIFLPYFTTKGKGGTGVGLSTVKQIIENCNGRVEVKSRLKEGTTFSIYFPEIK